MSGPVIRPHRLKSSTNFSDGSQHPGGGRPQHALPGPLLRSDHGEAEKHVSRNLRRSRDSNRLPEDEFDLGTERLSNETNK